MSQSGPLPLSIPSVDPQTLATLVDDPPNPPSSTAQVMEQNHSATKTLDQSTSPSASQSIPHSEHDVESNNVAPEKDFMVSWNGDGDPQNPHKWSTARRSGVTAIWVWCSIVTSITSSIFSSGATLIEEEFDQPTIIVTLGLTFYLLGYTVGPPFWGPLSEKFGRKWPMVVGMACFTLFCLPVALGKNIQTVLIGRFLCGAFGVAPLAIVGGALVDMWDPVSRGVALACCIGSIFGTPIAAPVIGNFVAQSHLGWRWDNWLSVIMGLTCAILVLFFLPETFAPVLLKAKAAKLRKNSGNVSYHSAFDKESKDVKFIVMIYLVRPFRLLVEEPILLLISLYQSFVYGIAYLLFVAYPIAFREDRHWPLGISSLPFLGLLVGVFIGGFTVIYMTKTKFAQATKSNQGIIIPELRLPMMIAGGCLIPVGFFIFAWTSNPKIHWTGMVIGSVPTGIGLFMVFVQCLNYIIDVYLQLANSAIAANTFMRSLFGAAFPLFGPYMYHNLGVAWATSLLGFLSIAMIPIPALFYKYGHTIRGWSKNAMNKNA